MNIYVLTIDQTYDYEVLDLITMAFYKEKDAIAEMKKWRKEEFAKLPKGWKIECDIPTLFTACVPMNWQCGHVEMIIEETELK